MNRLTYIVKNILDILNITLDRISTHFVLNYSLVWNCGTAQPKMRVMLFTPASKKCFKNFVGYSQRTFKDSVGIFKGPISTFFSAFMVPHVQNNTYLPFYGCDTVITSSSLALYSILCSKKYLFVLHLAVFEY